jgi:radical SAM protein with 4Fe4S-binding SPASM domain
MKSRSSEEKAYFCDLPWTGSFGIETNLDVTFCPCFLKMKIGNLAEAPILDIWNSEKLQELRRSFSNGELPEVCRNQLCPPAVGDALTPAENSST